MESFFRVIFLLFISLFDYAEYVYQIKDDSVRIYNTCDIVELILENHTHKVVVFLFNITEFQKFKFTSSKLSPLGIEEQDTISMLNGRSQLTVARYDLLSTNFAALSATDTVRWEQCFTNKPISYFSFGSLNEANDNLQTSII